MAYVDLLRAEHTKLLKQEEAFKTVRDGPYWQYLDLTERILLRSESITRLKRIAEIEETLNRLDAGQIRLADARFS